MPPIATPQKLRDQSGVTVLRPWILVAGRVLDRSGRPIAGASVRFGVRPWSPSVKTGADGGFRFRQADASESYLTVQAAGHSPEARSVQVRAGLAPVEFRLEPGRTIRGRIVDTQGRPVAAALSDRVPVERSADTELAMRDGLRGSFHLARCPGRPGDVERREGRLSSGSDGDRTLQELLRMDRRGQQPIAGPRDRHGRGDGSDHRDVQRGPRHRRHGGHDLEDGVCRRHIRVAVTSHRTFSSFRVLTVSASRPGVISRRPRRRFAAIPENGRLTSG